MAKLGYILELSYDEAEALATILAIVNENETLDGFCDETRLNIKQRCRDVFQELTRIIVKVNDCRKTTADPFAWE